MNKKTLFLALLTVVLAMPGIAVGQAPPNPENMVCNIRNAAYTIGASIVVIGWIIAGILYLTSAGSPEKTGTARKALIAAIIGTVLIILAYVAQTTIATLLNVGVLPVNC